MQHQPALNGQWPNQLEPAETTNKKPISTLERWLDRGQLAVYGWKIPLQSSLTLHWNWKYRSISYDVKHNYNHHHYTHNFSAFFSVNKTKLHGSPWTLRCMQVGLSVVSENFMFTFQYHGKKQLQHYWLYITGTRSSFQLTKGFILSGSPPRRLIASRMAAKSTTAGTPVKSWRCADKIVSISTLSLPLQLTTKNVDYNQHYQFHFKQAR